MLRNAVKSRARELLEEINHEEGGGELELVLMASILKEVSAEMVREVGREAREAGATWVEIAYVLGYTSSSSAIQLIDERTRAAAKAGRRIGGRARAHIATPTRAECCRGCRTGGDQPAHCLRLDQEGVVRGSQG